MRSSGFKNKSVLLLLLFISGLQQIHSALPKVEALYLFGDSLLDVGNNNYLNGSIFKCNFSPYGYDYPLMIPTGRYSNGKNTADFFAEELGAVTAKPYLSLKRNSYPKTGVNFASGRAGILTVERLSPHCISLTKQVEHYATVYEALVQELGYTGARSHLSKSIFLISIGTNDFNNYFDDRLPIPKTPLQAYIDTSQTMVHTLKEALQEMYNTGARKFALFGVVDRGCPQPYEGDCCGDTFNLRLKHMIQGLQSELPDLAYSFTDAHGFADVRTPCCRNEKGNCKPKAHVCRNRSDHVKWDRWHPTEAVCQKFVEIAFDSSQFYTLPSMDELNAT